jgi:predicted DNA-binding transcriptional regulator YafY
MITGCSPAERVLNLAAYLKDRSGRQVTLSALTNDVPGYESTAPRDEHGNLRTGTKEWETLRKRVARDLVDLSEHWGIVVDHDPAENTYRLRPPLFTPGERRALISAAAVVAVEGLQDERPGEVGSGVDDTGAQIVVHVHELVTRLRDAIHSRTRVTFEHEGRVRELEPYALGVWHGRWYVAGWDPDLFAMRRYRLERIEPGSLRATGSSGAFEVEPWFRPDLAFDLDPNSWGHDALLHVRARVHPDHLAAFLDDLGGKTVELPSDTAAWRTVEFDVRHYEATRNRILAYRGNAIVASPPELVQLILDHLRAIVGSAT